MLQKPQSSTDLERLVHAAHRFAKICRDNPVKLFNLLYMLDIRHYREAGQSCTGETYFAMADGPAPGTLRSLLVMRELDLDAAIGILTSTSSSGPWRFDPRPYCKNALDIMHELEASYYKATSRDLSLDDGNAWWRVYTKGKGVGAAIPYEMTLSPASNVIGVEKTIERKVFSSAILARQSLSPQANPQQSQTLGKPLGLSLQFG